MNRLEEQRFKELELKVEQLKQAVQALAYSGNKEDTLDMELRSESIKQSRGDIELANRIYLFIKEGKLPKR